MTSEGSSVFVISIWNTYTMKAALPTVRSIHNMFNFLVLKTTGEAQCALKRTFNHICFRPVIQ